MGSQNKLPSISAGWDPGEAVSQTPSSRDMGRSEHWPDHCEKYLAGSYQQEQRGILVTEKNTKMKLFALFLKSFLWTIMEDSLEIP